MKYTLKNTAYRGLTETIESMYISKVTWHVSSHTELLSEAKVWDTLDEIEEYIKDYNIDDHKIVLVKNEDIFEARLKGT